MLQLYVDLKNLISGFHILKVPVPVVRRGLERLHHILYGILKVRERERERERESEGWV